MQCVGVGPEGAVCQRMVPEGCKFCPKCGTPAQAPMPQKPSAEVYSWPCQFKSEDGTICGGKLEESNTFCGQCGTKVGSPFCRHCFNTLDKIDNFCPRCGQRLMDVVVAETEGQAETMNSTSCDSTDETQQILAMIEQLEKDEELARRMQDDLDQQGASAITHLEVSGVKNSLAQAIGLINLLENDEQIARQLQKDLDQQNAVTLATQSQAEDKESRILGQVYQAESDREVAQALQEELDHQDAQALQRSQAPNQTQIQGQSQGAEGGQLQGSTYEALLALDEELRAVASNQGVTKDQISEMSVSTYTTSQPSTSDLQCHICMSNYQPGETLRKLKCLHSFHCDCIDPWIQKNPTCPVCRMDVSV